MVVSKRSWHFRLAAAFSSNRFRRELVAHTVPKNHYWSVVIYHGLLVLATIASLSAVVIDLAITVLPSILQGSWGIGSLVLAAMFALSITVSTLVVHYMERVVLDLRKRDRRESTKLLLEKENRYSVRRAGRLTVEERLLQHLVTDTESVHITD